MLPDDWQALAPLVDAVLDAPAERRAEVLAEVSGGDPGRRAALERLVAECESAAPMFDRPAAERFAGLLEDGDALSLPETLGGRYRIGRELGRGGMACVYLARDTKHARDVAVKVIRPDVAASLGRDRFLREIGIAARLRHPNIVPLYDSGDAEGVLYFVMPYEEGPSLRGRLADRIGLPVSECVNALRDVARALVYAHEHGVMHRDVKPDNVMMSGGAAVVTDFGIAKAIAAAGGGGNRPEHTRTRDRPETITELGSALGTPAYMAPEQAIGDPATDHRADIYSFGCLAYELFTGNPPFHSLPAHQIIAAHVAAKPVPLSQVRPEVPDAVARLVARCLQKHPDARPQSAQELLRELEGSQTSPNEDFRERRRPGVVLQTLLVSAAVLVLGAGGYVLSRDRSRSPRAPSELTIAVMPSGALADSTLTDIADGLVDEIATELVRVPGLRVMSRGTVGKYRGLRDMDPQKIGQDLGASLLVTTALRGSTSKFAVTVHLMNADDGSDMYAHLFERNDGDFTAVREEIVRAIEQELVAKLGTSASPATASRPRAHVPDPAAHRDYLVAQAALNRRTQSIKASADLFKRAADRDTLYAEAYSGFSLARALAPYFQPISTRAVASEVTTAANHALQLDPSLAQPHLALGLVHMHAFEWDQAETEFRTALGIDPRYVEARIQYGRYLAFRDRIGEALQQFLAARNEDPASALVSSWVSYAYYLDGQLDSAVVENERAISSDASNMTTLSFGALVRLRTGDTAVARDYMSRMPPTHPVTLYVLSATADSATAMQRLRKLEGMQPRPWLFETMRAYALLGAGDATGAIEALERATGEAENWATMEAIRDPMYDPVRASERFHTLMQRVGLPMSATRPLPIAPASRRR